MQPIKVPRKQQLPIKPTSKPKPEEILSVAMHNVAIAQDSLLSPSAVIAALRTALDLYTQNTINMGFDPKIAEHCESLGQAIAKKVLESKTIKTKVQTVGAQSPLVDASGNTLSVDLPADEPRKFTAANFDGDERIVRDLEQE
jgi:hypothetical protein